MRGGWRRAPYLGGRHHRDLLEVVERHAGRLPEPHAAGKGKKSPCLSREPRASVSGRRGEREGWGPAMTGGVHVPVRLHAQPPQSVLLSY